MVESKEIEPTVKVIETKFLERLIECFLDFTVMGRPEFAGDEELVPRDSCATNTFAYGLLITVSPTRRPCLI